jgi:phosphoribosylformylglycinamidine cyclo-ligase
MPISYRDAGVDIDAGEELVRRIAPLARATRTPHVVADIGGFAGLCKLPAGMREPLLVSGTDGTGTKLMVAIGAGKHDTIGIDLVAMCVNDILTVGAEPLFFLDYFVTGKLDVDVAEAVIRGIAEGCRLAGCALLGGETAEHPGQYRAGDYDLAGFAVGVVERSEVLGPERVKPGDALVAIASSGLHANGYSLARRVILDQLGLDYGDVVPELGSSVAEALLFPTRIYAGATRALRATLGGDLHGLAHITGGGITDNLPRCLPEGCAAEVDLGSYARPAIFDLIARGGPVDETEMRRTFNLGVGLVAVVSPARVGEAIDALTAAGEHAWDLGRVITSPERVVRYR